MCANTDLFPTQRDKRRRRNEGSVRRGEAWHAREAESTGVHELELGCQKRRPYLAERAFRQR